MEGVAITFHLHSGVAEVSFIARNFLTRPPIGTPRRAISPGEGLPIFFTSLQGSGQGCPLLRASNEHRFIVRVLRARRAPGCSLLILLRPRVARARRILSCLVCDGFDEPLDHVVCHSAVAVTGSQEPRFSARMRSSRLCRSPTSLVAPESRHGPLPPGCFGQGSRTTRCPRIRSLSRTAPTRCRGTTRCLSDNPRSLPIPTATRP